MLECCRKNNFNIKSALLGWQSRDPPCRRSGPQEINRMMFVQQKHVHRQNSRHPDWTTPMKPIKWDRKAQRLTNLPTSNSKSPLQHKTDSPRISKECHYSCAELHCVTCGSECPYRTRKCRSCVRMALESGQRPTCWRTPHLATRFTAHKMSTTSVGGSGAPFSVTTPQLSRL